MKKILLITLALAGLAGVGLAQVVDTVWTRHFTGNPNSADLGRSCAYDSITGYLYIAGNLRDITNVDDYIIIKYDLNGDTVWVRTFNGTANSTDEANACAIGDSNNIYVTGRSYNGSNYDILTIKFKPNGDTVWTRAYNGEYNSNDEAYSCATDLNGNIFVAGLSYDSTQSKLILIKYTANGDTVWTRKYTMPGSSGDIAYSCAISGDTVIYVAGKSAMPDHGYSLLLKYKQNGDVVWSRQGIYDETARNCSTDKIGNIYISGTRSITNFDYFITKYNSYGDTLWSKVYNGPVNSEDMAKGSTIDKEGNTHLKQL